MKSLSILIYKPDENKLDLRARDFNPAWVSAATFLDNDIYLGAEASNNIYTLRKNDDGSEEERCRLQVVSQFHLGDQVNRFRAGSLSMKLPDSAVAGVETVIYGTIGGCLGLIVSLSKEQWELLVKVQEAMMKVVHGVGGLSWEDFRKFYSMHKSSMNANQIPIIDGDLTETLLELKKEKKEEVLAGLQSQGVDTDQAVRLVEELARLH